MNTKGLKYLQWNSTPIQSNQLYGYNVTLLLLSVFVLSAVFGYFNLVKADDVADEIPESFTLEQAVDYILRHNPDIQIQEQIIKITKAQKTQAYSAFLPQVDLTIQGEEFDNGFSSGTTGRTGHEAFSTIALNQPLFTFGKLGHAFEITRLNVQNHEILLEGIKQSVTYLVTAAFYNILLQEELVKVNEEAVQIAEEHLKTAQIRFDYGVVTLFDVTRAKVELANRRPDLISAKNDLKQAIQDFNQLLFLPVDRDTKVNGELDIQDYSNNFDNIWSIAESNRIDLKSQLLFIRQNKANVRLRKALHSPTLSLGGDYSLQYEKNDGSNSRDYDSWSVFLKITMNIFDGFNISGQVRESEAALEQAEISYQKLILSAKAEVNQTVREINKQKELIESAKETVELAILSLDMARANYENGRATTLDVADAELSLTSARSDYARAIYNYLVGIAKLKQAVGVYELPT